MTRLRLPVLGGLLLLARRVLLAVLLLGAASLGAGCHHSLEVKNLSRYEATVPTSLSQPVSVGIVPVGQADPRLLSGIATALAARRADVIIPYGAGSKKADVIVTIGTDVQYSGSGWNYPISFPGFLIFMPLWHGYNYEAAYSFNIKMNQGSDNAEIDKFTLPVVLDLRHANIGRTWPVGVDWLLTCGVCSFVGGFLFISYDDDVTPLVSEKVGVPLGGYIAQEVVSRINARGGLGNAPPPPGKTPPASPNKSVVERLTELKALRDAGTITEEEYEAKRKEALKGL